MKRLLYIGTLVALCLCGCSYNNTPSQAVVSQYNTDEVKQVQFRPLDFIVRDTNGAIWYVETESRGGYATNDNYYTYKCVRNTLLFQGIKKVDRRRLEE
jgi:hypothetical protein